MGWFRVGVREGGFYLELGIGEVLGGIVFIVRLCFFENYWNSVFFIFGSIDLIGKLRFREGGRFV